MPQDTETHGATASEKSDYEIRFVPSEKRVRVEYGGTWVADSTNAVILHETRAPPMYYFPNGRRAHGVPREDGSSDPLPIQGERQLLVAEASAARSRKTRSGGTRTRTRMASLSAAWCRSTRTW